MKKEDNELLCRISPGTAMGTLLRYFWLPALLEEELPEVDGAPVRLRLLGQDLVAFRDSKDRIGIVDAYCAHRRAGLFFGRNEDSGIRCVYHGWKFDVDGNCLEIPSVKKVNNYQSRVKIKAYKTALRGGVIWVYMGPPENVPALPDFEWSRLPEMQRTITKRIQRTNWSQAVEGGIDSAHVSFLHSHTKKKSTGFNFQDSDEVWRYLEVDKDPVFSVSEAPHGLQIKARRNADVDNFYWRVTQFMLPFYTLTPPTCDPKDSIGADYYGHAWVPIDDENCWTWSFHAKPRGEFTVAEREHFGGRAGAWGPVDEQYHPIYNMSNDYMINRQRQRLENYTGIEGIQNQDAAVQESMGAIVDRSLENLVHTDLAVVRYRNLMLDLSRKCNEGQIPDAAFGGEIYNKRPATLLLSRSISVDEGATDWTEIS
jgi:phenylpropionate dioxygenase-like ring-hydroxylating dioxygenase large terminal subunit